MNIYLIKSVSGNHFMTRRYVFIPLQYVYFSCTSEDYNNSFQIYTPAASAVSAGRRIICKFFITLQKFP